MGIRYLVSVLTHLSLQKEIPHSWGPDLPGCPEAVTMIFEATINCIQREMTSGEHSRGSWSGMGASGSGNDSGGHRVGFSRPKPIWPICLEVPLTFRYLFIIPVGGGGGGKRKDKAVKTAFPRAAGARGSHPAGVPRAAPKEGCALPEGSQQSPVPPGRGHLGHCRNPLPINTDEGFLRRLLGWNYVAQTKHIKWIIAN